MKRLVTGFAIILAAASAAAIGSAEETRQVVAGKEFSRGTMWRFWFGSDYRKAWTTAATVPVLDLKTEDGGLKPLRQVGAYETVGLALSGANGKSYTFRNLTKQPQRTIPKEWLGTEVETVVKDQTAAAHPAATAIVGTLAQSAGILFYGSRVMVMPDDPALGEFRKTFANQVGTLDEYPGPGYKGITEIISTGDLWKKWLEGGAENRIDSRAFLKARIFDLVTGNWDRHQGQWRWARVTGHTPWMPVPEDADQAFTRYEGFAVRMAAGMIPRFMVYSADYPGRMEGLTANNSDVSRWFPADTEWPVYKEVAEELQAQLTDAAIDQAVHAMPPEWYAIDGATLTKQLKQRRDHVVDIARRFYVWGADRVEVRGTDRDDVATVAHAADGSLDVTLAWRNADGSASAPYYHRHFVPKETKEVRVYLYGGNDHLVTSGPKKGDISLRVLGGNGNDVLDDSKSGEADLRDSEGNNTFSKGPGTGVDKDAWKNPAFESDRQWLEPRAYGHWTVPSELVYYDPTRQLMAGLGFTRTSWGFRDYPWKNRQGAQVMFSSAYLNVRVKYFGEFRLAESPWTLRLDAKASGIENLNYFGSGNETPNLTNKDEFLTQKRLVAAFPSVRYTPNTKFQLHTGVEVVHTEDTGDGTTVEEQEKPYGSGNFGEVKVRGGFEFDSRGRPGSFLAQPQDPGSAPAAQVNGVRLVADGFYAPKTWDATEDFGGASGAVCGYIGNKRLVLSVRGGGAKVWGAHPYFESASIGGGESVRGYYDSRFRGDSSLYGNAELRFILGHPKHQALPLDWGLVAFYDVGRVWLTGEDSNTWHSGYGGGIVGQVMGLPGVAFRATAATTSEGGVKIYVGAGFSY